jgi:serine/threonine protein kinase
VGPWRLEGEPLGIGGNATVRRGRHVDSGQLAAVKVLKTKKITSEPYIRFVREIETLRKIGPTRGVLPIIDSYLPIHPSRDDRPWLVMPVATSITEALMRKPLPEVVQAVHGIALALADLHENHRIAHRDIKPANLYLYEADYVIGDFGLLAILDLDELIRTGRPLGPTFFMADEMIADAKSADPYQADVFSLAKTLWVLAAEDKFPPQGHLRADAVGFRLSDRRPGPQVAALDVIIDRATAANPRSRPSMAGFSAELGAWLSEPVAIDQQDLSESLAQIRMLLNDEVDQDEEQRRRVVAANRASQRLTEALRPVHAQMQAASPTARFNNSDDFSSSLGPPATWGSPLQIWNSGFSSWVPALRERYELRVGRFLTLTEAGDLLIDAAIIVSVAGAIVQPDFLWRMPRRTVPVESTLVDRQIEEVVALIGAQLGAALEAFSKGLQARRTSTT